MNKTRVYDLSKELDINSKELVVILQSMDIPVKNHMSALTEQQEKYFRNNFNINRYKGLEPSAKEETPVVETATPPSSGQGSTQQRSTPSQEQRQTQQQGQRPSGQRPAQSSGQQRPQQQQGGQARPGQQGGQARPSQQGGQTRPGQQGGQTRPSQQGGQARPSQQGGQARPGQQGGQTRPGQQGGSSRPSQQGSPVRTGQPTGQARSTHGSGAATGKPRTAQPGGDVEGQMPQARRDGKKSNQKNKKKQPVTPVAIDNSKKERKTRSAYKKKRGEDGTEIEIIPIPTALTVGDFAAKINVPTTEIIKKLIGLGIMASINQEIDFETAEVVATELDITIELEDVEEEVAEILSQVEEEVDDEANMIHRAPVITVMGHVDHGKTSLLDAIRKTSVTEKEAGGITQHIGAYTVKANGENITFIDTPGHEAFTAMRSRGASITDIAVLVVAADDGVMPQTVEAINHAKAAGVPIIVAINKIDKPAANPEKVKQELTEYGLVAEEWGGETICVPVSAKTQVGLDTLLEMILLVSEVLELKANPNRLAKGTVLEANLDKGRGPVSTILISAGTLKVGDAVVSGTSYGKIRAMINDKGKKVKTAGPSMPVEVLGLNEVPEAGDEFYAVNDDKTARQIAEKRKSYIKDQKVKKSAPLSLDDLYNQIKQGEVKDLNIIIKGDVQGSVEALKQSLEKLSNEEVRVNIIHSGAGGISESDVMLASTSNGVIIGFNVRPNNNVAAIAERESVDIRLYRVIYDAIENIEHALKGMLAPTYKEVVLGTAEVRQVFKAPNIGTIAGSYVTHGKIARNNEIRVIRDGVVLYEGKIDSLKRFKDDVRDVAQGYECGISLEKFTDIKEGDILEAFTMEEVART